MMMCRPLRSLKKCIAIVFFSFLLQVYCLLYLLRQLFPCMRMCQRVILPPLIISLCPIITAVHYVHFLMWRLSVISTGGGIYKLTIVCLFSLVFCADSLFFWTRVVARLLRGKTCRGVTFILK